MITSELELWKRSLVADGPVRSLREYAARLHDQLENFKAVAKNMYPIVFDECKTDTQRKKNRKSAASCQAIHASCQSWTEDIKSSNGIWENVVFYNISH